MGVTTSRVNLSAARHPLVSAWQGRTIILPQHDMNFQKSAIFAGADQDRDVGVPQVFYMHNVMPTEQGYQSVGFTQVIDPVTGATDFDQAIPLVDGDGDKFLFVPAAGKNYVFDAPVLSWASLNSFTANDDVLVTSAFVNGETYVFYEQTKCMRYDKTTKAFVDVVLGGLVVTNIVGIVGSNGYLLAWDINGVLYWSSTVDPLDFVPSLITGAGSGAITDLKGRIVCVLPITNGFVVYATGNAVGGTFTGNLRFPFALKEIPGSGGIRDKEHVTYEANTDKHYALTSAGLQSVSKTTTELLMPEVSDFLTVKVFEDFDNTANTWSVTYLSSDLRIKLNVVASRYFVISYGISTLTHAIIYDIAQKKFGKVKIDHVDCFEYNYPNLYGEITYAMLDALGTTYDELIDTMYSDLSNSVATAERPKRNIGFLQRDGTVKIVNFDAGALDNAGVFLLGKFQFTRGRTIQLQEFSVENTEETANFEAFVLVSYDGKNFQPAITPYLDTNDGYLRTYKKRVTGENISLLYKGSFNLVSGTITYNPGGMGR